VVAAAAMVHAIPNPNSLVWKVSFQRHFNAISTPFQPHFNPICLVWEGNNATSPLNTDMMNFMTVGSSCIVMFQFIMINNWNDIYYTIMATTSGINRILTPIPHFNSILTPF